MLKIMGLALALFVLFLLLDGLWFLCMGNFFKGEIGSIARLSAAGAWNLRVAPALLVYVLMTIGLIFFVVQRTSSTGEAACWGALFGFVVYGIYDGTNLATLSAWTTRFALVDIMWGTLLNAVVAGVGRVLMKMWA